MSEQCNDLERTIAALQDLAAMEDRIATLEAERTKLIAFLRDSIEKTKEIQEVLDNRDDVASCEMVLSMGGRLDAYELVLREVLK